MAVKEIVNSDNNPETEKADIKNMTSQDENNTEISDIKPKEKEKNINDQQSKLKALIDQHPWLPIVLKYILVPLVPFFLGMIAEYVVQYQFPYLFNKPNVIFETTDISSFDQMPILLESGIKTESDILSRYQAVVDNKEVEANEDYSLICGDANNPGHGDVVMMLTNTGKTQAIIKGFEIEIMDYKPLDGISYSILESSRISRPDEYIVLYGSVDPIITKTATWRTLKNEKEEEIKISKMPIDSSLSPEEHITYYLRISFIKYGVYKLNIRVNYRYKGHDAYKMASEPVYILYDQPNKLMEFVDGGM